MVDDSLIAEAGARLATAAPNSRVILFGSYARGEADLGSDVDFLVVEPDVQDEAGESVRLMRELRDLRIPVDVVVVGQAYAEEWGGVRGSVVHAAISHGRVMTG
ncbi:MAG TPA: nucleotidyltransferase domain-containing protein [Solirubrobacterales bacterium]